TFTGKVEGVYDVGGIVGVNRGMIRGANNRAHVIGMNSTGGIAGSHALSQGSSAPTIRESRNSGVIQGTNQSVGGIVGEARKLSRTTAVLNEGMIDASSAEYVGGIAGSVDGGAAFSLAHN